MSQSQPPSLPKPTIEFITPMATRDVLRTLGVKPQPAVILIHRDPHWQSEHPEYVAEYVHDRRGQLISSYIAAEKTMQAVHDYVHTLVDVFVHRIPVYTAVYSADDATYAFLSRCIRQRVNASLPPSLRDPQLA